MDVRHIPGARWCCVSLLDLLFALSLLIGVLLVLSAALGGVDLDGDGVLDGAPDADGHHAPALLGMGRVPLVILAMLLSLLFGGTGLALSPSFRALLGDSAGSILSLVFAGAVAQLGTAKLGGVIARLFPSVETYVSKKGELVGRPGTALVLLSADEVVARVIDRGGAELRVRCRVTGEAVRAGDALVVLAFDGAGDRYLVEKLDEL